MGTARFLQVQLEDQVEAWPRSDGAPWETKPHQAHARLPTVYGQCPVLEWVRNGLNQQQMLPAVEYE